MSSVGMNADSWSLLVTIYDIRELPYAAVQAGDRHEQEHTAVVLV